MKRMILWVPILALLFSGCVFMEHIAGSGNLTEVDLGYIGFSALRISSAFEVTLIHDDAYSVTVMVDDNIADKVQSYRDGATLAIGLDTSYRYTAVSLKAVITMPTLTALELEDAARVTVIDSASFPGVSTFSATLSDASNLLLPSIVADTVTVRLYDASRANIGAIASDTVVTCKGASSVQMNGSSFGLALIADDASLATLKEFTAGGATVTLTDASEAWITVNGVFNFSCTGASTLYYRGAVDFGTFTIADASSIIEYN
ncbi:MAG: DUF2807 domain-containing protein [Spirochaetales bacterium]|nr:DUF2807 domain-containing protein [Spirochaetales bacterium]